MRKNLSFGLNNPQVSFLRFLSSAYLFLFGSGLIFILVNMALTIPFPSLFKVLRSWPIFKCSWQCLGRTMTVFILDGGFRTMAFLFLFIIFLRAFARLIHRLKETLAFQKNLKSTAVARSRWGVEFFVFPFNFPLALTTDWMKPKIFLSTSLVESLTQEELKTVLFHEAFHQKRRDPLRNLFISFLVDLLVFIPFTKKMFQILGTTTELQADFYSLAKGQEITSLITSLQKIHNYKISPELNLSHYSATRSNDLDRLRYFGQGKLKLEITKARLFISAAVVILLFFLAFLGSGPGREKVILEHQSSCAIHSIVNEEFKR